MPRKNNTYTDELKLEVVLAYLSGQASAKKLAETYGIQNCSQVVA
ncbi:MAG: transposase [Solibacillus sp.]